MRNVASVLRIKIGEEDKASVENCPMNLPRVRNLNIDAEDEHLDFLRMMC